MPHIVARLKDGPDYRDSMQYRRNMGLIAQIEVAQLFRHSLKKEMLCGWDSSDVALKGLGSKADAYVERRDTERIRHCWAG